MKKKVCQMVWNNFTNDARVLRECTSLVEGGYDVTLIAIEDPNNKEIKKYEIKNGIEIIRVNRYPIYYILTRKILMKAKKNKLALILLSIIYSIIIYNSLILSIIIALYIGFIVSSFTRKFLLKFNIVVQMIYRGFKTKADIYHSNDLNTLLQGYICSKVRRKPLIYDSHEVQSSRTGYNPKVVKKIENYFVKRVDRMIMTTDTRAIYTKDLYNIKKPDVIHNYPFYTGDESIKNKIDLHSLCNIDKNQPILLYQGGIQQGRGLEKIVEAIPMINKGVVVFIGDGKLKDKIKDLVINYNVQDRVRFVDKVPVDELKYYTASAYLGFQVLNNVCFNHYSALSNKLFEYIMSEIPVVACDFPEISRVVREGQVGVCVDSSSPSSIAQGVNYLLEDTEYYNMLKKNCKKSKELYNWENEEKLFVGIYDNILSINSEFKNYTEELKEI